jgi:DNA-binding beta-propeller fold protein YncE
MYVFDAQGVHAYADVGAVGGNLAPDRSVTLAGITDDVYDMAMNPDADVAFLSIDEDVGDLLLRVSDVSTRTGAVADFAVFDALGRTYPSSLAYDPDTDELYVWFLGALHVYEDATTAPDGATPARVMSGASLGLFGAAFDVRIVLDTAGDRLFVSRPEAQVAVFDGASTLEGDVAPDRIVTLTDANPGGWYIWGLAYDAARDELYVASQNTERAIFVVDGASTADGALAASRTIGGPLNPLYEPSMVEYDAARDRLFVVRTEEGFEGFAMFRDASDVSGDVPADVVVTGSNVPLVYPYGGYFDPTE